MRHLRDTTFVTWAVATAALAAGLCFAAGVGADEAGSAAPSSLTSVVGPTRSQAAGTVEQLRGLAGSGIAAAADPAALAAWGRHTGDLAGQGAAVRGAEGAGPGDQLLATFTDLELTADRLTAAAGNRVAAGSLRTRALILIDRLTMLTAGRPVPDALPPAPLLPHGPQVPAVPAAPPGGTRPTPAAPLPGQTHPHPAPDLTPDPPTRKDLAS